MHERRGEGPEEGRVVRKALLEVHITSEADRYVVAPSGELDRSTADLLEAELDAVKWTGAHEVVLDLSGLTFMDSTGLRLVLITEARSRADSNRLRLVRGPRAIQRVFELTGIESRLPFID